MSAMLNAATSFIALQLRSSGGSECRGGGEGCPEGMEGCPKNGYSKVNGFDF